MDCPLGIERCCGRRERGSKLTDYIAEGIGSSMLVFGTKLKDAYDNDNTIDNASSLSKIIPHLGI